MRFETGINRAFICSEVYTVSVEHPLNMHCSFVLALRLTSPIILFTRREGGRGNVDFGAAVESGERVTFDMSTDKPRGDMVIGEAGGNAGEL